MKRIALLLLFSFLFTLAAFADATLANRPF